MFDKNEIKKIAEERKRWELTTVPKWVKTKPERQKEFYTISGIPVKRVYTPEDIKDMDYMRDLGFPGEYPFTRGIHATMYRGKIKRKDLSKL